MHNETVRIGGGGRTRTPSREHGCFQIPFLSRKITTVLDVLEKITYISSCPVSHDKFFGHDVIKHFCE